MTPAPFFIMVRVLLLQDDHHQAVLSVDHASNPHPWSAIQLLQHQQSVHSFSYGLFLEEELIAFALFQRVHDEASLLSVVVSQNHRRKGFAKHLLQASFLQFAELGVRVIYLEVRESNFGAQSLYEQLGFSQNGVRQSYYSDRAEDALLYCMSL